MMDHIGSIARFIDVGRKQVEAAVQLLDEGNTIPFIARYRKEATGGLDEEQLRQLGNRLEGLRALDKRRQTIHKSISDQGRLTPDLAAALAAADSLTALEDLYLPFKPKRRTRAIVARERGLQGLADLILAQERDSRAAEELARPFLNAEVPNTEAALAGARDIVAETISDQAQVRGQIRTKAMRWGSLHAVLVKGAEDPRAVYRLYYDYEGNINRIRPHQVLAVNRGEAEKILRVRVEVPERDWRSAIATAFRPNSRSAMAGQLEMAIEDAAKRLLLPAIGRDVRRTLTERAEAHAIGVFATNLRGLLTQPPLVGHTVMGIDPGYRTGCKVVVVDPTGKVLTASTIFPHQPRRAWQQARRQLAELMAAHAVSLVAIGNGTASRETEQLVAELLRDDDVNGHYLIVSEAGASVYSASPLARAELPDMDVSMRGAVSIGRRVQDPLAELVKIDPQSIGVGMYQHDVNQTSLAKALAAVVESVVNRVGVDVNTASPALLAYVAGIGPKLAERIVARRDLGGPFRTKQALLEVPGLGPKSFEQAAGFLRVRQGDNPLDASAIHPESYGIARAVLTRAGLTAGTSPAEREKPLSAWQSEDRLRSLAFELDCGLPTLVDIIEQLLRPGRDPRADLPQPILRRDIISLADLAPGMQLTGTVRNVVDFGAFVDVGVKHDGLLHRSQWPRQHVLTVGEVIEVVVLKVEPDRGRIALGWPG